MNSVVAWSFGEIPVRTVEIDGQPWWVLADVCAVLELTSPHKIAERLEEDEKGGSLIPTLGGSQWMTIINESGLYSVIIRSDKPNAKEFRRWITHEVLPAIRRTGSYSVAGGPDETAALLKTLLELTGRLVGLMESAAPRRMRRKLPDPSADGSDDAEILAFLSATAVAGDDRLHWQASYALSTYRQWCNATGRAPMPHPRWHRAMCRRHRHIKMVTYNAYVGVGRRAD